MKKIIYYYAIAIISVVNLYSYQKIDEFLILNRNYIGLDYQRYSTSSFFDYSGTQTFTVPSFLDSLHKKEYSYEVQSHIINLNLSQNVYQTHNSNYFLSAGIPLHINSYEKKYKGISDTVPDIVILHSDNNFPYLNLKAGVDFKFSNFYLSGGINYNLSLSNNKLFEIFDTYYSNILPEISVIYDAGKSYFNLDILYRKYMNSDINDEFAARFAVGITTVESSVLRAFVEYNKSLKDYNTNIKFNPEKYSLQQEFIKLGIDFRIMVEQIFTTKLGYELIMGGKNTPVSGKFSIGADFLLDLRNI